MAASRLLSQFLSESYFNMIFSRLYIITLLASFVLITSSPTMLLAASDDIKTPTENILMNLVTEKMFSIVLENARYRSTYSQYFEPESTLIPSEHGRDDSNLILVIAFELSEQITRSRAYHSTLSKLTYDNLSGKKVELEATIIDLVIKWTNNHKAEMLESINLFLETTISEDPNDRNTLLDGIVARIESGEEVDRIDANIALLRHEGEHQGYECKVCLEHFPIEQISVLNCRHFLCKQCMNQNIDTKLEAGIININCHMSADRECSHTISDGEIQRLCPKDVIKKYEELQSKFLIRGDKNIFHCLNHECGALLCTEDEDPTRLQCYVCHYKFCFKCKDEWHEGYTCEQYQEWKIENSEAEGRFIDWKKNNTKQCPVCDTNIEKSEGCFKMTCTHCNHKFCWKCLQPWNEYGHINRPFLPNGQENPCYDEDFYGQRRHRGFQP